MVVRLIEGHARGRHPAVIDTMFRGRAEMFATRLQWDVEVRDGWEIDLYDDFDPLYLVAMSSTGQVKGSLRLMPTTGRTLMTEVFAPAFDEPVDIRSALVWEGTRFCVHPQTDAETTRAGVSRTACELFMAMCEVSIAAGLTHILAVYDRSLPRIYQRIGWVPDTLAASDAFRHGRIFAGLFEVSEEALDRMRTLNGISETVLENAAVPMRRVG